MPDKKGNLITVTCSIIVHTIAGKQLVKKILFDLKDCHNTVKEVVIVLDKKFGEVAEKDIGKKLQRILDSCSVVEDLKQTFSSSDVIDKLKSEEIEGTDDKRKTTDNSTETRE
jgi:DNA-binding protein